MTDHTITITENPTIHATRSGSTINHTVTVNGECIGWVVEHRDPDGEILGWGVWGELASEGFAGWVVERRNPSGEAAPGGLFASRDAAAKWLIDHEIGTF